MKIAYKKRHLKVNLFLGIMWLVLAFLNFNYGETNWISYGYLVLALLYLTRWFYQSQYKYLTIDNGIIKENWPFGKEINLADIENVKYFAGDLILKTNNSQLTIHKQLIDEKSFTDLENELKGLNIQST
jgi:hypothetical protein